MKVSEPNPDLKLGIPDSGFKSIFQNQSLGLILARGGSGSLAMPALCREVLPPRNHARAGLLVPTRCVGSEIPPRMSDVGLLGKTRVIHAWGKSVSVHTWGKGVSFITGVFPGMSVAFRGPRSSGSLVVLSKLRHGQVGRGRFWKSLVSLWLDVPF